MKQDEVCAVEDATCADLCEASAEAAHTHVLEGLLHLSCSAPQRLLAVIEDHCHDVVRAQANTEHDGDDLALLDLYLEEVE